MTSISHNRADIRRSGTDYELDRVQVARQLRIEHGGALYHVTWRGDGREALFGDDGDRDGFLRLLGEDEGDRGLILASTIPR